jgi:dienelactone hydrolase
VVLQTLPGHYLAGNLYRPKEAKGPMPGILSPHGHYQEGRVHPDVQARCIRWARLGCMVFLYDMVGYADSEAFEHEFESPRLERWGQDLTGLQTWNSIRALDWLTSLPEVDAARIACTGESGGGTQTFLLAALDDRVKFAAPVVMVSDAFQGGCQCENTAGLRLGTDNMAFAALAAPRPMILVGATGDWTARTVSHIAPAIRRVYDLFGMPGNLDAAVFPFEHNYNQTSRNAVYAFLGPHLLGIDDPARLREGEQTIEKPEDLFALDADHPAPADRKTSSQLEEDRVAALRLAIEALAPGEDAARWGAARDQLATIRRVRIALDIPPASRLFAYPTRTSGGTPRVEHLELADGRDGARIPAARVVPEQPRGITTVLFSARGKAALVDEAGAIAALPRELLAAAHEVVVFDPLLVGESVNPADWAARRPATAHFLSTNPALAVDRLRDLARVIVWCQSRPGARQVNLVGEGAWGALALQARPLLPGLGRTLIDLNGGGDRDTATDEDPAELVLPGALQAGGLKAAAALVAPEPLWITGAGADFRTEWPARAYELASSRGLLRVDAGQPSPAEQARWIDTGSW